MKTRLCTTHIAAYTDAILEVISETCWPARCAICDRPGEVLCAQCRMNLAYLDWWRACKRCGAPFGRVQCSECNSVMLASNQRDTLPHDGCASAVIYNKDTARIVRAWKDQGERRLSTVMASLMEPVVPRQWLADMPVVSAIPATTSAYRRRGFDHGIELAGALAALLDLRLTPTLARPHTHDQRPLDRRTRHKNMRGQLHALPNTPIPPTILMVDDVYTTGATLYAACDALHAAGAHTIYCLTFARVW